MIILHKKKSDQWYRDNYPNYTERFCYACLKVTWCRINDYINDICVECKRCYDDHDPNYVNPNRPDDVLDFFNEWKSFVHHKIKKIGIDIGDYND